MICLRPGRQGPRLKAWPSPRVPLHRSPCLGATTRPCTLPPFSLHASTIPAPLSTQRVPMAPQHDILRILPLLPALAKLPPRGGSGGFLEPPPTPWFAHVAPRTLCLKEPSGSLFQFDLSGACLQEVTILSLPLPPPLRSLHLPGAPATFLLQLPSPQGRALSPWSLLVLHDPW